MSLAPTSNSPVVLSGGATVIKQWNINGLVFDGWLQQRTSNSITSTDHPVATGAEITDHSYVNRRRFSLHIGMTDVLPNSQVSGQFPANPTRSINAFQTLRDLMNKRQFVTITDKYGFYDTFLIESIDVDDDATTVNCLRATVNLVEVILANTQTGATPKNPQAVNQTNRGQVAPIPAQQMGTWAAIQADLKKLGVPGF